MSMVEDLAAFVVKARYEDLSGEACRQPNIRALDALGSAPSARWMADRPRQSMNRSKISAEAVNAR